jgi:hypothetical protein
VTSFTGTAVAEAIHSTSRARLGGQIKFVGIGRFGRDGHTVGNRDRSRFVSIAVVGALASAAAVREADGLAVDDLLICPGPTDPIVSLKERKVFPAYRFTSPGFFKRTIEVVCERMTRTLRAAP